MLRRSGLTRVEQRQVLGTADAAWDAAAIEKALPATVEEALPAAGDVAGYAWPFSTTLLAPWLVVPSSSIRREVEASPVAHAMDADDTPLRADVTDVADSEDEQEVEEEGPISIKQMTKLLKMQSMEIGTSLCYAAPLSQAAQKQGCTLALILAQCHRQLLVEP